MFPQTYKLVDMFPNTTISLKIANTSILSTRPMWKVWRGWSRYNSFYEGFNIDYVDLPTVC